MTRPEKVVIPLFFKKTDRGELTKLFRKDSVLKYMMDNWKEEAVLGQIQEDIQQLKETHPQSSYLNTKLKALKAAFSRSVQKMLTTNDQLEFDSEKAFRKFKENLEKEVVSKVFKYYAILEEHKRLANLKYEHIKQKLFLTLKIEKVNKKLLEFSKAVKFETWNYIKLIPVDEHSTQFSRCQKALHDNLKSGVFQGTYFTSLKLQKAFKIQNQHLLKHFEKLAAQEENSFVKGLFTSVSKKQIPGLTLFGPKTNSYIKHSGFSLLREKLTRVPKSVLGKSKLEEFLSESKGFTKFLASKYSVLQKDLPRIQDSNNSVFYIVLSRMIIDKKLTQEELLELEVQNMDTVYPEYVMICTKEKGYFEIVPEHDMLVPAYISEASYSNPFQSNRINSESFLNLCSKALDQSFHKRRMLRKETLSLYRCQLHCNPSRVLNAKKAFAEAYRNSVEELQSELENLRKSFKNLQKLGVEKNII